MADLYVNKNGTWVNIKDEPSLQGLTFFGLTVQSPQPVTSYQTNPGVDGEIDPGNAGFGPRTIEARFFFAGEDLTDFELACRDIWSYFYERDPYCIRSSANPAIRYRVRAQPFDPNRIAVITMQFSIVFDLLSGFGESIGTTLDMFTYEAGLWQYGMHLPNGRDLAYVFNTSSFKVYNASDIDINPMQHHELQIALTCEGTPTVTNKTTGDVFQMKQAVTKDDVLLLNGIYPYLNDNRCGRLTNHGIITLKRKAWNDIEITGVTNIDISWMFHFLYH
jgi:hypothetical protein